MDPATSVKYIVIPITIILVRHIELTAHLSGDRIVFKLLRLGAGSGLFPAVWGNDIFLEAGIGLFKLPKLFKLDALESLENFLNSLFVRLEDLLNVNSVDVLKVVLFVLV